MGHRARDATAMVRYSGVIEAEWMAGARAPVLRWTARRTQRPWSGTEALWGRAAGRGTCPCRTLDGTGGHTFGIKGLHAAAFPGSCSYGGAYAGTQQVLCSSWLQIPVVRVFVCWVCLDVEQLLQYQLRFRLRD